MTDGTFDFLGRGVKRITPVGSRETCNPAPEDTDEDWLILVHEGRLRNVTARLEEAGYTVDGHDRYDTTETSGFVSWRSGEVNVIVTEDPEFHDRFVAATSIAKRLNLLSKSDRVALFQAVLYGRADQV
jgi:hypothetical protein